MSSPVIHDVTGLDVGPILTELAADYQIPLALVLACAKAESGMDPNAYRDGVWPDKSCGPFQQTVLYAEGYGVGDGTATPGNVALCRHWFSNWRDSGHVAAPQLAQGYKAAASLSFHGDEQIIAALSKYNAGSVQPSGNWWWQGPNCASYRTALAWAKGQL